ncbi:MAG: hypothetical protein ACP5HD_07940 [Thermoproteus sp.]
MDPVLAILIGAALALTPLLALMYQGSEIDYVRAAGLLASFADGFVLGVLAQLWGQFYVRLTYLLALGLMAVSLAYSWWGIYRRWWTAYLFAASGWAYLVVLLAVARALGLPDPFLI